MNHALLLRGRLPSTLKIVLVLIAVSLPLAFTAQGDLEHTVLSSQAILKGHFWDFYSFNKTIVGGNDYLIPVYILFAIWIAPLYALGLRHQSSANYVVISNQALSIWSQLLIVIFFCLALLFLIKISRKIGSDVRDKYKSIEILVFSPFVIFTVFFIGQYDIIWLSLAMVAIYCGLVGKNLLSSIFFGAAISIKYFALPIFIFFIIFFRKSPKVTWVSLVVGFLPSAISMALYFDDDVFVNEIFELPVRLLSGIAPIGIAAFLFFSVAIWITLKTNWRPGFLRNYEYNQWDLFVTCVAICFSLLFSLIRWNPQWLIISAVILGFVSIRSQIPRWYWAIEGFGFAGLSYLMLTTWSGNLDQFMVRQATQTFPEFHLHSFAADLLPSGMGTAAIILVQCWILCPAIISVWNNRKISLNEIGARRVRLAPILCWITPVMLTFLPISQGTTSKEYAQALMSPSQTLGKYHSQTSIPMRNARFDLQDGQGTSGIALDIWSPNDVVTGEIKFLMKKNERVICQGNAIVKKRADDIFWSKGWKTAYLLCGKSVELNILELVSNKTFSLWLDSKTQNRKPLFEKTLGKINPVMSFIE